MRGLAARSLAGVARLWQGWRPLSAQQARPPHPNPLPEGEREQAGSPRWRCRPIAIPIWQRIVRVRREYNQRVADETLEDYALRFTARSARRWSVARVANTALGVISFLALEAIG